ncbi:hypothetical protein KGF56_001417 [Candida oxycetoniae]|uniref:SET domain-containing protein n=1 Tax=Candida oxycetoniae TaxID=497107 RepID=A0AAI9SZT3_9ASCO|nr:uncharacterized protein KGF56_001417 [Candida oxycetoniae]KAI3405810.2 hypothetical protein KGF56_001417 [Candida oxycetoniae]
MELDKHVYVPFEVHEDKYTDSLLQHYFAQSVRDFELMPLVYDKSDNFTMAPYIDFINHSCDDHCTLKIDGKGFQITTTTELTTEDQLYLSYGSHSNGFLLTEYGFTMAKNNA